MNEKENEAMRHGFQIGWYPIRRDSTIVEGLADWYYVCGIFHDGTPMAMNMLGPFHVGGEEPMEVKDHMEAYIGKPNFMLPRPMINLLVWGTEEKGEEEAYLPEFKDILENAQNAREETEQMVKEMGKPMYIAFINDFRNDDNAIREWKEQANAEASR